MVVKEGRSEQMDGNEDRPDDATAEESRESRTHATRERTLALPYLEISRINSVIAEIVEISRINSVIADCCLNLRFLTTWESNSSWRQG